MAILSKHPTRAGSQRRRLNEIAERIVLAARAHFFAHGFRSVTMDDLAAELGMSKKTLYAQFPSKTELLKAVLLAKFRSIETDLDAVMRCSAKDASAALHQLLACMQRHTEEIQPPFVRDIRRESPELFELVEERRRDLIQRYFGRIFDQGRRAGIIRKDISSELIVEILLGAVQAVMNPAKIEHLGLEPKTGYGAIVSVILNGAMTEKGRSKSADWAGPRS
ncbi:MAG: TetR/AcrR family transcriptional regulator [Betaproteobacteria bacterium]